MHKSVSAKLVWSLIALGGATMLGAILLVLYLNQTGNIDMSGHGWGAMLAGTFISMLVGGVLTCALVWGRQNGFDERADIVWETEPEE